MFQELDNTYLGYNIIISFKKYPTTLLFYILRDWRKQVLDTTLKKKSTSFYLPVSCVVLSFLLTLSFTS
jgi:hypothetical protein